MIENIGEFVKNKRLELGLTQMDLAVMLNITDKAVSKWERGLSYPDIALLPKLADIFSVSVEELIYGKISSMENADTTVGILSQDRKEKAIRIFNIVALSITFLGIFITFIVNFAVTGYLSWALYVVSGFALVWAVYLPIRLIRNRFGKYIGTLTGAVGAGLYCLLVEQLTSTSGWAKELALPIIAVALITTTFTLISVDIFKNNKPLLSSITLFLNGVVLNMVINLLISNHLGIERSKYNNLGIMIAGMAAAVLLVFGWAQVLRERRNLGN